ncbi:phosphoglycerate mutase [Duganella sp. Leaf126]|uniref:histidine phosphatase family protein n=1 Tax=Duganella sp. Leaf126 TaxID=1736266 RepID=UPI0006FD052C|nr:histidine phosphatase family protein [Duganella sp. Leaf126]KQQ47737.1 phosphoglycerate mutase [Duganella sp. Leaf126]
MGQIFLVRSAQASFGSADYDQLSARGVQQARLLGRWFASRGQQFHRVLTGGMVRHAQAAHACQAEMPAGAWPSLRDTEAGFAEFDHHEVMLRHCPEFADPAALALRLAGQPAPQRAMEQLFRAAMQRWMTGWHDDQYAEAWPEFRGRVVAALERLDRPDSKQATLVFTSSGVIATVMQHVLGLQDYQVMEMTWKMANCSVTRLLHRPGEFGLDYFNNYAHLEALGGPDVLTYR